MIMLAKIPPIEWQLQPYKSGKITNKEATITFVSDYLLVKY